MNRKSGFTLIELLVVIAIIAILAAILFPVFTSAKQAANQSSCLNNIGQIGKAVIMYAGDNQGRIPNWWFEANGGYTWDTAIWKYIKNKKMLTCPVNKFNPSTGQPYVDANGKKIEYVRSYAMPKNVSGQIVEQAPKPSATVLLYEKGSEPAGEQGDSCGEWFSQTWGYDLAKPSKFWHNNGKTFAFCDGHAAFFKYPRGPFSYDFATNFIGWSTSAYPNNPGKGTPGYCGYADNISSGDPDAKNLGGANLPR